MNMQIALMLVDTEAPSNKTALACLADDFEQALAAYEHAYVKQSENIRTFTVKCLYLSCDTALQKTVKRPDPDMLCYAIACTDKADSAAAVDALSRLERMCEANDIPYRGGAAIAGGRLIAPCARGPRMGRMRRPASEALDRLILAVRCQCSIREIDNRHRWIQTQTAKTSSRRAAEPMSNIVVARCPVPTPLYNIIATHYEKGSAHAMARR